MVFSLLECSCVIAEIFENNPRSRIRRREEFHDDMNAYNEAFNHDGSRFRRLGKCDRQYCYLSSH